MSIKVNPEILVWARKTAGLSVEDAAAMLQLTNSARSTDVEKLEALEGGLKQPTRNQLNSMANLYKRPLLSFYMAVPPRTGPRGQDFRQSPDERDSRANAMLDALLRDIQARQETVRDILEDEEDFEAPDFVGSTTIRQGVEYTVTAISEKLSFDHFDSTQRRGGADMLFRRLRAAAEEIGIFVLVLGDLGSHHTTIPATVFRGFTIADRIAPFVVINAKDARPARAFTLIHELAHIWLGETGVSGSVSTASPTTAEARIERFCNDVAGEFLLPGRRFTEDVAAFDGGDIDAARSAIEMIAARWSVSEPMAAYRLKRLGDLTTATYDTLRREYAVRWQATLVRSRETGGSGPNPRVLKQFYLGNALMDLVHRNVRDNVLSHTKAAAVLGSKPGAVEPLLKQFESRRGTYVSKATAAN